MRAWLKVVPVLLTACALPPKDKCNVQDDCLDGYHCVEGRCRHSGLTGSRSSSSSASGPPGGSTSGSTGSADSVHSSSSSGVDGAALMDTELFMNAAGFATCAWEHRCVEVYGSRYSSEERCKGGVLFGSAAIRSYGMDPSEVFGTFAAVGDAEREACLADIRNAPCEPSEEVPYTHCTTALSYTPRKVVTEGEPCSDYFANYVSCAAGQACVYQYRDCSTCMVAKADRQPCEHDAECQSERCVSGFCLGREDLVRKNQLCRQDQECIGNLVCRGVPVKTCQPLANLGQPCGWNGDELPPCVEDLECVELDGGSAGTCQEIEGAPLGSRCGVGMEPGTGRCGIYSACMLDSPDTAWGKCASIPEFMPAGSPCAFVYRSPLCSNPLLRPIPMHGPGDTILGCVCEPLAELHQPCGLWADCASRRCASPASSEPRQCVPKASAGAQCNMGVECESGICQQGTCVDKLTCP